ncbi:hypothetical protein B0H63DRAFT_444055 [Podospora didyma]|uniref:Uncharacterized protein n=1 Tax=Podospora didyma TaxID=330526 RepID=A0AAE0U7H5_9PEZI|nr:hypothetical protein B0H63DRAFT_444055 [Podospora didyma]
MARTYRILHRVWRAKRPLYWGMLPELAGTIAMLVLFGLQQPDLYRSKFWQIGFNNQLNSNPAMVLYAYANYEPLPSIPLVWSQTLTNFNVAISIVSLFILLGKMIAVIMKVFYPIIGLFTNLSLTALYAVSVYGQAGPDYADPRYPSSVAWYIRMGCDIAKPYNMVKQCQMAKGTFAATIFMMTLYLCNLGLAAWSMLPNPENDFDDDSDDDNVGGKQWEMQPQPPMTPRTVPFTPRTLAFNTLDRKLPLRHGYA